MGAGEGIICICSNNIKFLVDNAYTVNRLQKMYLFGQTHVWVLGPVPACQTEAGSACGVEA